MKQTVVILSLLIIAGCQGKQNSAGYDLAGTTVLSNNTSLYLEYSWPDEKHKYVDSTKVIGGEFAFHGTLPAQTVNALIRTKDFSTYKFIWLENRSILFTDTTGNLRNARVEGSVAQMDQDILDARLKKVNTDAEKQEVYQSFVNEHPYSIVSAKVLSVYASTWGKAITTRLFNNLTDNMRTSPYGKNIEEFIRLNKEIKIGDRYYDFSQADRNNKHVRLSDFDGKVILLEFWGSWCGPCRKYNPDLVKVYSEYKDKGFEIVGVAAETDKDAWVKAIEADKLSWPNVSDLRGDKNEAALMYGVSSYPANFLIDRSGSIISKDLSIDELREKLKELL